MIKDRLSFWRLSGRIYPVQKYSVVLLAFFVIAGIENAAGRHLSQQTGEVATDTVPAPEFSGKYRLPGYTALYPVLYSGRPEYQLAGAVGYLKGEKFTSTPSAFISNAFTGRIAGLYTHQLSGEPGNDGVDITLRGRNPLVLVDGVPRTVFSINPEEIESVTVLKDALSTAMLGIRSMNGAILITTRKGENTPGFNLDLTAQAGVAAPIKLPRPLSAFDYARLYNEALANDGKTPLYSATDLDAYKTGNDPFGHPDVNWYDEILKRSSPFSRYTLNAEGSGKSFHYFVSLDYLNQQGIMKQSSVNTYNTNTDYQRYIFRSNIGVDINSRLSMSIDLFGRVRNQNEPGSGAESIFTALRNTPANAYPVLNPDGSLGGNVNYSNNIYGQAVQSGYMKTIYSDGYADLALKRNMDDVLKGWWIKGMISYNLTLNQQLDRSKNFETFRMQTGPLTGDTSYQRYGTKSDQKNNSAVINRGHQFYAEASTGYMHHWNNDNTLDILLTYNLDNYTDNSDLPDNFETLAGRVQYGIRGKYILEAVTSYSGNNRYAPGNRYGVFPAAGAAWNIQKEGFFNKDGFINTLKLRASYGLTGNSVAGYYDYVDHYAGATGYHFGTSAAAASGRAFKQPRDVTTWEKALKADVGLDMSFAKDRGVLTIDYYRNKLKDLVQPRMKASALLGWGDDIVQNIGKSRYSGWEITAGWADKVRAFSYYISGNLSVSNSKVLFNDEPAYPYSWMQTTGRQVGQLFGYVADGFVSESGEGPVMEGYNAVPGDIKYRDLNNDGVINQFDRQAIGSQKPLMFYGADMGVSWKGLDLTLLIQGVANRNILLTGANEWEFQNDGKGQAWQHHLGRWTPSTSATAAYPRLSVGNNVNNEVVSSFWVRSGSYLRLKNVELSYAFNKVSLGKVKLRQLRLFVDGLNLLTAADFKQSDPETPADAYPVQRIINGGVTVRF